MARIRDVHRRAVVADEDDRLVEVAGDFMTALQVSVDLDTVLEDAARLLRDADALLLVVMGAGQVLGIISGPGPDQSRRSLSRRAGAGPGRPVLVAFTPRPRDSTA